MADDADIELDDAQRRAVEYDGGDLFVKAPAGAGKTRVIERRTVRLVERGERVAALAFTNDAADEMADRIGRDRAEVSTLHSLCYGLLREWGVADDVVTPGEAAGWIASQFADVGWDFEAGAGYVAGKFDQARAEAVEPGDVGDWLRGECGRKGPALAELWGRYRDALCARGAVDYAGMIHRVWGALTGCGDDVLAPPEAVDRVRGRWDQVIADEAQDLNRLQLSTLDALASEARLTLVGDLDQSIYGFRGASPDLLEAFRDDRGMETIALRHNYRSAPVIVDRTNRLRERGDAHPGLAPQGGGIRYKRLADEGDEADWIAQDVQRMPQSARETAVLYRTNAQAARVQASLERAGVPCFVGSGSGFYSLDVVQRVADYLEVLSRSSDFDRIFKPLGRVLNEPTRYLGSDVMATLREHARRDEGLEPLLRRAENHYRNPSAVRYLREDLSAAADAYASDGIAGIVETIARFESRVEGGATFRAPDGDGRRGRRRADAVDALARMADDFNFKDPAAFADALRERADGEASGSGVELTTIHGAKGREWPLVYVVGCTQGLFPHRRGDRAEERRIAYVAATRAADELVWTSPAIDGRGPSPDAEMVAG